MPHSRQQYEQRITRLEADARRHPAWFNLQVALLVALGLLAIPFAILCSLIVFLLACLTVVSRTAYLAILALQPLAARIAAAVYAVRLQLSVPNGIELRPDEAPRLFELLEELTRQLRAPRFHHVLITDEFSASMVQLPRLGPLGWQRNYLLIGLPMLLGMDSGHFTAVLAHELAHLSNQHSRFSLWVERAHQAWQRFMEHIGENKGARFGLNWFFNWYVPVLQPHAFVLARLHEIDADRFAATLTGARTMAETLVASHLGAYYLKETFGKGLQQEVQAQATPPRDLFHRMRTELWQPLSAEDRAAAIAQLLDEKTNFLDPHPSTPDRLAQLGFPSTMLGERRELPANLAIADSPNETAATILLGSALEPLLATLNEAWWLSRVDDWQSQHYTMVEAQEQLSRLPVADAEDVSLTAADLWIRAKAVLEVSGPDAAIPLFECVLEADPRHMECRYLLGQVFLHAANIAGIDHLRFIMEYDVDHALDACRIIYDYLGTHGLAADADRYAEWAETRVQQLQQAQAERQRLTTSETFLPHDWSEDDVASLQRQLAAISEVSMAYLIRKTVILFPEKPCYILAVMLKLPWLTFAGKSEEKVGLEICNRVKTKQDFLLFTVAQFRNRALLTRWKQLGNALIYQRAAAPTPPAGKEQHAVYH